jgi:predicted ATPase
LIGPNGTGKSNFLDALAFLARALATTPYEAVEERGGLGEILRRVPEPTDSFSIYVEAALSLGSQVEPRTTATYGFELGLARRRGVRSFEVIKEWAEVPLGNLPQSFQVEHGAVSHPYQVNAVPEIQPDRLYLPVAGAARAFGPLFIGLSGMRFYNFVLGALRQPAPPSNGALLAPDGGHLADVLDALAVVQPDLKDRFDAYLSAVAPGIDSIDSYLAGGYATIAARSHGGSQDYEIEFGPGAISDGTIRAAAVLAALFQLAAVDGRIPLVGIEEPEIALHPAAAGVLFDALTEASEHVQVVATSQSPDLLDRDDLDVSSVRAVSMEHGLTVIGDVDEASQQIVRDKLYTLGELMRSNQISPHQMSDGNDSSSGD